MAQIDLDSSVPVDVFAASPVAAGSRVAITPLGHGRVEVSETSDFAEYEIIQADSTGYSRDGLTELWVRAPFATTVSVSSPLLLNGSIPDGVFTGLRAVTVQNYTEANVKNGLQYEASAYVQALPGGDPFYLSMTTGAKPIILKAVLYNFNGEGVSVTFYSGPTFTGGTPLTVYGLNEIAQVATTVTTSQLSATDVTNPGTQISATNVLIGNPTTGTSPKANALTGVAGQERILSANTTHLISVTNINGVAQDVSVYYTWYEGEPDLPLV